MSRITHQSKEINPTIDRQLLAQAIIQILDNGAIRILPVADSDQDIPQIIAAIRRMGEVAV